MALDPLDPEEGVDTELPYCEAVNGLGPHNYQPLVDVLGGTGVWLFCTQCGDHFTIDGTAPQPGTLMPTMPSPATPTGTPPAARPSFP